MSLYHAKIWNFDVISKTLNRRSHGKVASVLMRLVRLLERQPTLDDAVATAVSA
jgi:hypothetical protein